MADKTIVGQDAKTETTPTEEVKPQLDNQVEKKEVDAVPYSRFADAIAQKNELQKKVSDFEKSKEESRVADLEKKGEHETLIAELRAKLETAEQKSTAFDEYVSSKRETILSTYSDEERDILGELSLEKLEKYHESKFSNKKIGVDSSRAGTAKSPPKPFHEMTPEEKGDPGIWQRYLEGFKRN